MPKLITLLIALLVGSPALAQPIPPENRPTENPLSREEYAGGAITLFDGASIRDTWTAPGLNWAAQDGALVRLRRGGDAWFHRQRLLGEFELSFEYQGEAASTGGLAYLRDETVFAIGLSIDGAPAGCPVAPIRPGVWHKARIRAAAGRTEHWVDGVKLCESAAPSAKMSDEAMFFPRMIDGVAALRFRYLHARPIARPGQFEISTLAAIPQRNALAAQLERYVTELAARPARAALSAGTGHPAPMVVPGGAMTLQKLGEDGAGSYYRYTTPALRHLTASGIIGVPKHRKGPFPVLFALHGTGGSPELAMQPMTTYHDLVRGPLRDGWLVIAPQMFTLSRREEPFGYAISAKQVIPLENALVREGTTRFAVDAARMSATLDRVVERWPIDPRRVVATGLSDGGHMSNYLMAVEPRIIAGVSVAGFAPFATPDVVPTPLDLIKLVAPRPFMLVSGRFDPFKFISSDWADEFLPYVKSVYGDQGRLEFFADYAGHDFTWAVARKFFDDVVPAPPARSPPAR